MTESLSVVLPTYNRADILDEMLVSLAVQQLPEGSILETVVVDDCSSDNTLDVLRKHSADDRLKLKFKTLSKNSGPAVARNEAVKMAQGNVLLITGDDMVPAPGLLEGHINWHREHESEKYALLGNVSWDPDSEPSSFMKWLENAGRGFYFNFKDLKPGVPLGSYAFYTSNISLKREFLERSTLCDMTFPYASHEDLELGYRLETDGMQLFYDPNLVVYHRHDLEFPKMAKRVYVMGYSAAIYWERVPDTASVSIRAMRNLLTAVCRISLIRDYYMSAAVSEKYDTGYHPLMWKICMLIHYCTGLSDRRKGLKRRI